MSRRPERIAVVGLGGIFPGAPTLDAFWENLAARRCAAKAVPPGRWLLRPEDVFDPARGAPDKVYSLNACLVEDFVPDLSGFEVSESLLKQLDPLFHFGLHAARQAWLAASTKKVDRSRVGVIIGHIVLPSDSSSALSRELLTPAFERHALGKASARQAAPGVHPLNRCVAGLPAGLISKALGLGGTAYTLDAACASSLYAVKLAVEELRSGRADVMLTGGLSRPESLYTQMGFSQLRALSARGIPAPFDASGDGLVVGEGAGILALKRYDDAVRDGDRIRGVIVAAGLSNDVGGSLLAPNTVGQLRAMRAAYQEAGWSPSQVDYVECHATGTPTGDPVETASLKALWGERGWSAGQCALGSVKSNVGHMLTAAGAAGLVKMLLAFKKRTLPPTANFDKPNPRLGLEGSPFRVQSEARRWETRDGAPRRAAVSGFGFGGINAHVLMEEDVSPRSARRKSRAPSSHAAPVPVAIVGMETRLGPLSSLREFQEAVLSGAHVSPSVPQDRWFGVAGESSFKGFLLKDVGVRAAAYRVPPKEIEEMLPQQLLMLDTAAAAIRDCRLAPEGRESCGVFIGLGLDLNACNFHFRWSLLNKARELAAEKGWELTPEQLESYADALREAAGPALSANRTMGALGGIVASRIAREFQIGGPSFTLSSEETSGLRALEAAVRALQRGELSAALVGAVDVAGDARQALSTSAVRPFSEAGKPFDRAASGPAPAEGAVCLVLKRLDDALKAGDRVYAVIKGLGASCGGGIEEPAASPEAYAAALRRAYSEAGLDASTVSLIETHGSGAPSEDAAEARALAEFFGVARVDPPCALGALKAQLGHAGASSGLFGVAKAALALYQEILPPCRPFDAVEELARARKRFHVPTRPQYWLRNRAEGPRRAGVSAMGLDGGCAHVVLEQLEGAVQTPELEAERRQPLGARAEALFALEADEPAGLVAGCAELRRWAADQEPEAGIEALARRWLARRGQDPGRKLGLAVVARSWKQLLELAGQAEASLRDNPERPLPGDRVQFTFRPSFGAESVAFVFPGSGNQYLGMGVSLGAQFPQILRTQDAENGFLRRQLVPERYAPWRFDWRPGWEQEAERELSEDYRSMIFGSVAHGTHVSDLIRSFGVSPRFVVGYSLGETAGLFALRAWTARDEMLRRMNESSLFVSDLAGPCDAARQFWNLPTDERVDWVLGVIDRPADTVRKALKGMERAALLIVNAPLECVVGGYRKAVDSLVQGMGCVFLPLQGVSTVHFPAAKLVEKQYRDLHLLPTTPPEGVRFYSGVAGKAYPVTRESAADSITAQAIKGFDYSAVIRQAYDDGARVFIELGPQSSCTRMIGKILGPLPHAARSACVRGQDEVGVVLRALAALVAERIPVDLKRLYGGASHVVGHQPAKERPTAFARLGGPAPKPVTWRPEPPKAAAVPQPAPFPHAARTSNARPLAETPAHSAPNVGPPASLPAPTAFPARSASSPVVAAFVDAQTAGAKAHESFLAVSRKLAELQAKLLSSDAGQLVSGTSSPAAMVTSYRHVPEHVDTSFVRRALTREQCLEFAVGSIAKALGPRFASADAYPTRVRLPDEPLMLVDRVTEIEGEPQSMKSGRVVTEHDVKAGAWYLDNGRIPTCVAVEAGQADLFLSGFLGIDDRTKGLSVYRLLDADVTFHGSLPKPEDVIRYDIRIDRFVKHGDAWLFFFSYDGTVSGRPLITMRNGCAGFFSQEELAAGKGVVLTADELKPVPGKSSFTPFFPLPESESYADAQLNAIRSGDLSPLSLSVPFEPLTLPSGKMNLVHRVNELRPKGGRYGLGWIRGEADIHPDDWHLVCHFKDDNVMPGTLMYECCLHTLRVLLMRLGWVGDKAKCVHEPVVGVKSKLKCRGQVLASTKKVHYEISVKELGYNPAPYAIADALMFSDGKPIVHITDMSLALSGTSEPELKALWSAKPESAKRSVKRPKPLFDHERILAYAVGKPSEAFGEPYKIFDEDRVIARLPGPPYQFLDRIVDIRDARPFELAAGAKVTAEYDVPKDAWYFKSHRQPTMPFAVLLEAALQPCGWLAAYLGSALTSPVDLKFRNLGGTATQRREVTPASGTLRTSIELTKVAMSGGMIIQDFSLAVRDARGVVYEGTTEFGFFTAEALDAQVGIRGAKPYAPSAEQQARLVRPSLEDLRPSLPDEMLLMLDEVELFPDAGPKNLGFARGTRRVNPSEWFFKAHFYQDPVCPGSLGLESFLELLKAYAATRWPSRTARYEAMTLGQPHTWLYRGQYTPVNKKVEVQATISAVDESRKAIRADGYLSVDGLTIYSMKDFSLRFA